ncbi:hypothetical protein DVH24_014717, partial [Malus domestica]
MVPSKLFVQCSRQKGLIKIYRHLLNYQKNVFNLCSFPSLVGIKYRRLRHGFQERQLFVGFIGTGRLTSTPMTVKSCGKLTKVLFIAPVNGSKTPD